MEERTNLFAGVVRTAKRQARMACQECAAAKVKCLPQNVTDDGKCERCQFRGTLCAKQAPVVRKRRTQKTGRVAKLEQKLDNIVTLLQNNQPQSTEARTSQSISNTQSPPSNTLDDLANLATSRANLPTSSPELLPSAINYDVLKSQDAPRKPLSENNELPCTTHSSPDDEANLEIFKTQLIWYFPFVVIPSDTTAKTLREQKPFLFRTIILAVTHHGTWQQKDNWKEIVDYLSLHVFLNGEKSLDLLQGLLVYVTWSNYSYYNNSQTSILTQMAVSLANELCLTKAPHKAKKENSLIDASRAMLKGTLRTAHTLEEQRTLVGCFYLSTIVSGCLKKIEPMRYSAYLEKCCQALVQTAEYQTDHYLVQMVRLQHHSVKNYQTFSSEDVDATRNPNVPIGLYVHAIESELQNMRASLPVSLQNDTYIMLHYYAASIPLYELAFQESANSPTTRGTPPFQRLELLHACLTNAKSLVDTFFLLPVSVYPRLPFMAYALLSIGLVALSRLCLFDSPDWDRSHGRSVANLVDTLELFAVKMLEAHTFVEASPGRQLRSENSVFETLAWRVRKVKGWYEDILAAESKVAEANHPSSVGEDTGMPDFMALDEDFWKEFMTDWGTDTFAPLLRNNQATGF